MTERSLAERTAFQAHMVELARAFGWHRPDSTPCGQPVPISEAYALLELSKVASLTQQELAEAIHLRKSTVSGVVSSLERRGWIERRRNGSDGRSLDVSLTPRGQRASEELADARAAKMSGVLERIPADRRADVLHAMQTLIEAVHESEK